MRYLDDMQLLTETGTLLLTRWHLVTFKNTRTQYNIQDMDL